MRGFYSHGLLMMAVLVVLLWQNRDYLFTQGPNKPALQVLIVLGLLGAALGWYIGWAATIGILEISGFVGVVWLSTGLLFGPGFLYKSIPYFTIVMLSVPVWNPLVPVLQALSTTVVTQALFALGKTIHVEGNFIYAPYGSFEIAGGCSGLGYFLVSVCLSLAWSLLERFNVKKAVIFTIALIVSALVVNWLRILLIILSADLFGIDNPIVKDHVWFGWFVFIIFFTPFFWWLQNKLISDGAFELRNSTKATHTSLITSVSGAKLTFTVVMAIAIPVLMQHAPIQTAISVSDNSLTLASWDQRKFVRDEIAINWRPSFINPTKESLVHVIDSESRHPVSIFIAYYEKQTKNGELISIENQFAGDSRPLMQQTSLVTLVSGQSVQVNQALFTDPAVGRPMLMRFWYTVAGRHATTAIQAKLLQILALLEGRHDGGAIAITSPCVATNCTQAAKLLDDFAQSLEVFPKASVPDKQR